MRQIQDTQSVVVREVQGLKRLSVAGCVQALKWQNHRRSDSGLSIMEPIAENSAIETALEPPSVEQRRALIERVAASGHFSRSARLRDFLLYVGRQSLKDGWPEIHEQEIGAKVFGRPLSYDRSADNIVRVNATELRKRIELYFESTGAQESLIFEIPRGGYTPVFRLRAAAPSPPTQPAERLETASEPPALQIAQPSLPATAANSRSSLWTHAAWALVALMLLVGCLILMLQNRTMRFALHPWDGKPAVEAFWTDFLRSHQRMDVVLPDDSASVVEDISGRPSTLGDYLSRNDDWIAASKMSADRKEDLLQILNHNLVTFGAVRAAQDILNELPASYTRYMTFSRYYTPDEMKRDNVVLVGGKKAVPWDHLFDDEVNFFTDYDDVGAHGFVRNRHPQAGELAMYDPSSQPNSLMAFSVIAYLPNPSGAGNAIILAGTDSDATEAAAEFLLSEEQMEGLQKLFHSDHFPYFEVLLKTSRLSGTSFNAQVIAYRTHPELR